MWKGTASNALANIVSSSNGMVFQIGITAIALRCFDSRTFSVWALAFSIASLVPLFSISLSTVVTRQLVVAATHQRYGAADTVLAAARQMSALLAGAALVCMVVGAWLLAQWSPLLADTSAGMFVLVTMLVALSQVWLIGLQPSLGWHYARGRNWTIALGTGSARGGALVAALVALVALPTLWGLALSVALGTWGGLGAVRRWLIAPRPVASVEDTSLTLQRRETTYLLKGFAVWSLGAAAVQYALPSFVAMLDAPHYNAFYLAYSLNMIVVGVMGTAGSALLAPTTRRRAEGDMRGLASSMTTLPAASAALLLGLFLILWLALSPILATISAGKVGVQEVEPHLRLLAFQTIARSTAVYFAILLSAGGNPMQLARPIMIELGLTALIAAPIGWHFGDLAFLASLAWIGAIAAACTMWVTLQTVDATARERRRIGVCFVSVQALAALAWYGLTDLTLQ